MSHHAGYRFPWEPPFDHQPDFHDFHHKNFTGNYGLLGVMDYLHGTDAVWRKYETEKRSGQTKDKGD